MSAGRLAATIVVVIIIAIVAFLLLRPGGMSQHGQPSPHALDQSQ